MAERWLLRCGIFSMLWYVAINIIVPLQDPAYDSITQTVSELSAIDAPTRMLWVVLCFFYTFLFLAFGLGVWLSANGNAKLRLAGIVIIIDAVLGLFWPPMHLREIIAAGGGTLTDTLHLVWAFIHLAMMLLMIGLGAAANGPGFRIFSGVIVFIFFMFGILTVMESRGMEAGLPTPYIGIWERINIAAYMVWVIVFSLKLLNRKS